MANHRHKGETGDRNCPEAMGVEISENGRFQGPKL